MSVRRRATTSTAPPSPILTRQGSSSSLATLGVPGTDSNPPLKRIREGTGSGSETIGRELGEQRRYRDLYIFEERLRMNALRHLRRQILLEFWMGCSFVLGIICLVLTWYFYHRDSWYYWTSKLGVGIAITTFILLKSSQPFKEAKSYIPHCNRALEPLNLQLSSKGDRLLFHAHVPQRLAEGYAIFKSNYQEKRLALTKKSSSAPPPPSLLSTTPLSVTSLDAIPLETIPLDVTSAVTLLQCTGKEGLLLGGGGEEGEEEVAVVEKGE